MSYDLWKCTDWAAELAAEEEAMVERCRVDWVDVLDERKVESELDNL